MSKNQAADGADLREIWARGFALRFDRIRVYRWLAKVPPLDSQSRRTQISKRGHAARSAGSPVSATASGPCTVFE